MKKYLKYWKVDHFGRDVYRCYETHRKYVMVDDVLHTCTQRDGEPDSPVNFEYEILE